MKKSVWELLMDIQEPKLATEPAVSTGSITGTVAGVVAIALYFFPNIPPNVIQGILVVSAFLLPIITALFTRGQVWSPDSVKKIVDEAVKNALQNVKHDNYISQLPPTSGPNVTGLGSVPE